MKKYYIRHVEKILKVKRKTLFVWEAAGKVPPARREVMSGYRYWLDSDIQKLKKMLKGKGA